MSRDWLSASQEILRYLTEHPEAKDTAGGILEWWLSNRRMRLGKLEIEEILAVMVQKGWLIERKTGTTSKIYGVSPERIDEIEDLLAELARTNSRIGAGS